MANARLIMTHERAKLMSQEQTEIYLNQQSCMRYITRYTVMIKRLAVVIIIWIATAFHRWTEYKS